MNVGDSKFCARSRISLARQLSKPVFQVSTSVTQRHEWHQWLACETGATVVLSFMFCLHCTLELAIAVKIAPSNAPSVLNFLLYSTS
jgi:hypothetical protein